MAIVSALPASLLARAFKTNQLAGPPLPYGFFPEYGTEGKEDKKTEKKNVIKIKFSVSVKSPTRFFTMELLRTQSI